jgi:hypothetical protein
VCEGIIQLLKSADGNLCGFCKSDHDVRIFREHSFWLPRIVAVLLVVFAIDVALASTCCPLPMDAAPGEAAMPDGADCPQDGDASKHPDHNACCLSCVMMFPVSQFPELDTAGRSFYSQLAHINPSTELESPYRPPIQHLL